MIYEFEKDTQSGAIFIPLEFNSYTLKMVLDTGASNTTFDFAALCMAGYVFGQASHKCMRETANGVIEVDVFEVESLTALGHTVYYVPVHVYDFMAHGILSDYDGMLGLDFFENTVLTIDMENCTVEINSEPTYNQNAALLSQNAALLNQNAALSNENA
jgi:predicted aspartyl protease